MKKMQKFQMNLITKTHSGIQSFTQQILCFVWSCIEMGYGRKTEHATWVAIWISTQMHNTFHNNIPHINATISISNSNLWPFIKEIQNNNKIAVSFTGYVYDETMKNIGNFMVIEIMKSEFKHSTFGMGMKWDYGWITW